MSHRRAPPVPLITEDTAPIHFEWSKITVWRTVYQTRSKKASKQASNFSKVSRGNKKSKKPTTLRASQKRPVYTITIFSLERPKRQVILKTPSGKRVFEAISCKREERGFIEKVHNTVARTVHNPEGHEYTMGKTKTVDAEKRAVRTKAKGKKDKTEAEGTEDDENVEAELAKLESLADDEVAAVEPDPDADDDPEDKKSKKGKGKRQTQSRAAKEGKVGTKEISEAADVDSRTLRMVLRKHGPTGSGEIDKDAETGRWEWDSMDHKDVRKILGWIKRGEARDVKNESLQKLKDRKAQDKAEGKDKKSKKDKKKNKKNKD